MNGQARDPADPSARGDLHLPAQLTEQLPIPILGAGPQPEPALEQHPDWRTWAHQRRVVGMARHPGSGELWLATTGGVLRWSADRARFTRYGSEHGLPGSRCAAIAVDGGGQVWCAPERGGLYRLAADGWSLHPDPLLRAPAFSVLELDPQGRLWAGAAQGLYQLDPDGNLGQAIPFPEVEAPRSLALAAGAAWLCNSRGLFRLGAGQVAQAGRQPTSLAIACAGEDLWVGKLDGLVHIDLQTNRARSDPAWPRGAVTALLPASGGVYVVSVDTFGWAYPGGWDPLYRPVAQPAGRLGADGAGGVWIAAATGLLHWSDVEPASYLETRWPPDLVEHPTSLLQEHHLPNLITSLAIEADGVLWAGTASGLFRHDPQAIGLPAWQYAPRESIRDVQALAVDPGSGCLWLADLSGGLYTCPQSGNPERLPELSVPVQALCPDSGGGCWAIALDGVWRLRDGKWLLAASLELLGAVLYAAAEVAPGELWFATSLGLAQCTLEAEPRVTLPKKHPFAHPVTALAYDPLKGVLWAGTQAGLFALRRQGDGWSAPGEANYRALNSGLADDHILALALDSSSPGESRLWIGTAGGLSRFRYAV